jgi:hypothetical protein
MLNYYISLVIAYILGGITFIPFAILAFYLFSSSNEKNKKSQRVTPSDALEEEKEEVALQQSYFYKVGWLRVSREQNTVSKSTSIGCIVKSYLSGGCNNNNSSNGGGGRRGRSSSYYNNSNEETSATSKDDNHSNNSNSNNDGATYFAVLKFNTLYLYDSELQLDCRGIINISNHTVHIYPCGLKDYELFGKINRIQLKMKKTLLLMDGLVEKDYYINCSRCVDKEDWYIALERASKLHLSSSQHGEPASKDLQSSLNNSTHFDQDAMNHLISTVHSDPSHFELQWLNALLGRIFLGIYKTEKTKSFFYNKILSKIAKLNARRPPFLEEITVRSVDGGHGPPLITQPRLIHLSPQGEYTGDVHLFYDGHFRVELETVLKWKYSDRLPPIRIDLVLAITLKSIEGELMFKIKEPPTNHAWMGFYKKPKMEWIVEPLVWEKRMGYSMVSKAIQTKIEDIIAETMVLPNMDDMVFFQTEGVGGIYGEEDNFGKSSATSFDLDKKKSTAKSSMTEKQLATSDVSSLSYQSLPGLYSSPSELVVTADHFPLLSTSVSSTAARPVRKSWFRRNNNYNTYKTTIEQQSSDTDENGDTILSPSPVLDTPSQQTLKSVITPIINQQQGSKNTKDSNSNKMKRKRSILNASTTTNNGSRAQLLATNVDHSIQSLLLSNNTKSASSGETPTVQSSSSPPCKSTNKSPIQANTSSSLDNTTTTSTVIVSNKNDALHSVRLSKKMLLLMDHHRPSRLRSKSLPSTGLSIDVAQMGSK